MCSVQHPVGKNGVETFTLTQESASLLIPKDEEQTKIFWFVRKSYSKKKVREKKKGERKKKKLRFLTAFCGKISLRKTSSTHWNREKQTPLASIATILQDATYHDTYRKGRTHLIF